MVEARVTSTKPTVVGSIPTGDGSWCSSVVEQRKERPEPLIPAAKKFRCGEGARYFRQRASWCKPGRMRKRKPACLVRGRSSNQLRGPMVPTGRVRAQPGFIAQRTRDGKELAVPLKCRDGAGKSYFVCDTTRGSCSAALLNYSSRLGLPARIADRWAIRAAAEGTA